MLKFKQGDKVYRFEICQKCYFPTTDYDPQAKIVVCGLCSVMEFANKECPNHGGAFDCNSFCSICEGEQEY